MANHCQLRAGVGPAAQAKGKGVRLATIAPPPPRPDNERACVTFGATETTMFRVDKTMHRFGLKKPLKTVLARLPNWDEREWPAAQAARRAAELAYLVGGIAHWGCHLLGREGCLRPPL